MKNTQKKLLIISASLVLSILSLYAAEPTTGTAVQGIKDFSQLISTFTSTVATSTATLLLSAAMIAFFYGIVMYVWGIRDGDTAKVTSGNTFMKWALVALFVMFSVYGIIRFGQQFICGTGGCDTTIKVPTVKFTPGTSTGNPQTSGTSTGGTGVGNVTGGCGVPFDYCTKNGVDGTCSADGAVCEVTSSGGGGGSYVACTSESEIGKSCQFITNDGKTETGVCYKQRRPDIGPDATELTCKISI